MLLQIVPHNCACLGRRHDSALEHVRERHLHLAVVLQRQATLLSASDTHRKYYKQAAQDNIRKTESIHHHHHHPAGVVYRSFCPN